jgi:hypothetical protein
MSRLPSGLADGQLSSGSNTIYTAAADTDVVLTNLVLTNTGSSVASVDIYLNRGTSRLLMNVKVQSSNHKNVSTIKGIALDAGDIMTMTSDSTNVNYDLSGFIVS